MFLEVYLVSLGHEIFINSQQTDKKIKSLHRFENPTNLWGKKCFFKKEYFIYNFLV